MAFKSNLQKAWSTSADHLTEHSRYVPVLEVFGGGRGAGERKSFSDLQQRARFYSKCEAQTRTSPFKKKISGNEIRISGISLYELCLL